MPPNLRIMNQFRDLAERTGLSVTLLTSIRDDEVYPSLGPLVKIARALGVRLGTFLDDQIGSDPLVVRRGAGCRVEDEDGRTFLDFVGSWGPLILGHRHPAVIEALTAAIEPIMIVLMGGIVGSMLIAMYLPMFSLISQIG